MRMEDELGGVSVRARHCLGLPLGRPPWGRSLHGHPTLNLMLLSSTLDVSALPCAKTRVSIDGREKKWGCETRNRPGSHIEYELYLVCRFYGRLQTSSPWRGKLFKPKPLQLPMGIQSLDKSAHNFPPILFITEVTLSP